MQFAVTYFKERVDGADRIHAYTVSEQGHRWDRLLTAQEAAMFETDLEALNDIVVIAANAQIPPQTLQPPVEFLQHVDKVDTAEAGTRILKRGEDAAKADAERRKKEEETRQARTGTKQSPAAAAPAGQEKEPRSGA